QMSYALAILAEWQSPDFQSVHPFHPLELWIILVLVAAFSLGWRLPLTRTLLSLLLLHMALQHQRFGELLGVVTPLLVAPALMSQLGPSSVSLTDRRVAAFAKPASVGGVALAGAVVLGISGILLPSR